MQANDERDYKALIFSCSSIDSVSKVASILDWTETSIKQHGLAIITVAPSVDWASYTYLSQKCYYRTQDPAKKRKYEEMKKRKAFFEYKLHIVIDSRSTPAMILVTVPFSAMSLEVFGRIHNARPSGSNFRYIRPALEQILARASISSKSPINAMQVTGSSWILTGDLRNCERVVLRGANIVRSPFFRWLTNGMNVGSKDFAGTSDFSKMTEIMFTLHAVEICYLDIAKASDALYISFDRFGNYTITVPDDGTSLINVLHLVRVFSRMRLMLDETSFPVRDRSAVPRLL